MFHKSKSFTLIEVVVVMGVMGLIMGGLLTSMRQVVEGETLLKKMQAVEEETRFIMDTFAQDAEYSELDDAYKSPLYDDNVNAEGKEFFPIPPQIKFIGTETKGELGNEAEELLPSYTYTYGGGNGAFYLKRVLTSPGNPDITTTLNNTPLNSRPEYRIKAVKTPDGSINYFITISIIYGVNINNETVLIPVETSVMSRTFVL